MGLVKRLLDEPPWFLDDKKVCGDCFEDDGIKLYIKKHSDGKKCDFCNNRKVKSLTFSMLMDFISNRISERYTDPLNAGVPYERGFIFEGQSIEDLLEELQLGINSNTVWERITRYLGNDNWIRNDWNMSDDPRENDELYLNWEHFCKFVKTKKRFFFNKAYSARILSILEGLVKNNQLIKKLESGTVFYRARAFKKNESILEYSIKTLGPPTPKDIMNKSSRMSPAGIPLLYCSKEKKTACLEIFDPNKKGYYILMGKFKLKKSIHIVDFTQIENINVPSYFDESISLKKRDNLIFLKNFPEEMSKPIKKDGREHTEYVPTQIITEFLKDVKFQNHRIMGIGYRSAIGIGTSYALFFRREYDDKDLPVSDDNLFPNLLFLDRSSIEKIKITSDNNFFNT